METRTGGERCAGAFSPDEHPQCATRGPRKNKPQAAQTEVLTVGAGAAGLRAGLVLAGDGMAKLVLRQGNHGDAAIARRRAGPTRSRHACPGGCGYSGNVVAPAINYGGSSPRGERKI
ncbi:hypothetical protein BH23GEM6_BH23GEM6_25460 [soil metagenome]